MTPKVTPEVSVELFDGLICSEGEKKPRRNFREMETSLLMLLCDVLEPDEFSRASSIALR